MVVTNVFVTVNPAPETKKESQERKPYDDRELKPGEVLVPMMAFHDRVKTMDVNPDNIRTWHDAGRAYKVMFYPVPKEAEKLALQQFDSELNEYLGYRRDARCLIPQEDGTYKVCPKKNGDNRCACKDCPHRGEYDREDKTIVSLDELRDKHNYEPATSRSAESEAMFPILLKEFIEELQDKNPQLKETVTMRMNDVELNAMFDALNVKKSQGYNLVDMAKKELRKFLYS